MINVVLVCLHERPCRAARQKPKKKTQIQTEDLPANELNFSLAACCWSVADTRRVNRLVLFFFFFLNDWNVFDAVKVQTRWTWLSYQTCCKTRTQCQLGNFPPDSILYCFFVFHKTFTCRHVFVLCGIATLTEGKKHLNAPFLWLDHDRLSLCKDFTVFFTLFMVRFP